MLGVESSSLQRNVRVRKSMQMQLHTRGALVRFCKGRINKSLVNLAVINRSIGLCKRAICAAIRRPAIADITWSLRDVIDVDGIDRPLKGVICLTVT